MKRTRRNVGNERADLVGWCRSFYAAYRRQLIPLREIAEYASGDLRFKVTTARLTGACEVIGRMHLGLTPTQATILRGLPKAQRKAVG